MLIIFGGLPGTGRTTLARALALQLGAVHLRIDSIEQAIMNSSVAPATVEDAGYLVCYALAEDNLQLGRTVVADSVNPVEWSRSRWRETASRAAAAALEVETICSDTTEHRRRIETRTSDIERLRLPSWQDVIARDYEPWKRPDLVIDTARAAMEECLLQIREALPCPVPR